MKFTRDTLARRILAGRNLAAMTHAELDRFIQDCDAAGYHRLPVRKSRMAKPTAGKKSR
jgi:hypothetical protein